MSLWTGSFVKPAPIAGGRSAPSPKRPCARSPTCRKWDRRAPIPRRAVSSSWCLAQAKEKLRPHLDEGNVRQTMSAPATVIVAYDTEFYEKLFYLAPNSPDARSWFAGKPEAIERAGFPGLLPAGRLSHHGRTFPRDRLRTHGRLFAQGRRRGLLSRRTDEVELPDQSRLRHPPKSSIRASRASPSRNSAPSHDSHRRHDPLHEADHGGSELRRIGKGRSSVRVMPVSDFRVPFSSLHALKERRPDGDERCAFLPSIPPSAPARPASSRQESPCRWRPRPFPWSAATRRP